MSDTFSISWRCNVARALSIHISNSTFSLVFIKYLINSKNYCTQRQHEREKEEEAQLFSNSRFCDGTFIQKTNNNKKRRTDSVFGQFIHAHSNSIQQHLADTQFKIPLLSFIYIHILFSLFLLLCLFFLSLFLNKFFFDHIADKCTHTPNTHTHTRL